jgi:UDP-N-acetylglucosamine--N-acetylmuramyl-(pentapeptide) pyrophosphoryl-undecaprenol N-acetylglucosamine transferase
VDHAFIGFPQAAARLHARETTVTGTPVRSEFHARDAGACRTALGFDPARPVVLIMGGSQGATGINELVLAALPQVAARLPQAQWLHLAGARDAQQVQDTYANLKLKAVVHPFLQEMGQVLAGATVAVSRAGASSLAELAALRLPAVLVPFPHAADNHQLHNARAFVESGAALLLEQVGASHEKLVTLLADLIENQPAREKMRSALGQWHSPRAAEQIAGIILTVMDERVSIAPRGDGTRWENHSINLSAIT